MRSAHYPRKCVPGHILKKKTRKSVGSSVSTVEGIISFMETSVIKLQAKFFFLNFHIVLFLFWTVIYLQFRFWCERTCFFTETIPEILPAERITEAWLTWLTKVGSSLFCTSISAIWRTRSARRAMFAAPETIFGGSWVLIPSSTFSVSLKMPCSTIRMWYAF